MQRINQRTTEERAYLSTVLESVSTGVIAVDRERCIRSINPAALRILELRGIAPKQRVDEIFVGELGAVADFFASLQDRRGQRPREVTIIRSGELHYLELSAAPLEGGGTTGWVVAIEDSTQLVRAQKLAAWNEAARRIAHEIKNPLTPIQLSAERILKKSRNHDPDLAEAVDEGCRTIVREVGQLKRMVDEFSRFARMPAVHLRETPLAPILEEVAALYRAVKPDVTLEVEADETLRAVVDPEQIRRALINLVDNAIEATDHGAIRLALEKREHSIVLQVTDPGRGVPDSDKDKLFLPYFSTKGRGTGLGLAIVHRIVHDHDGRISVHDNLPKGTRFEIELPA
jgi:two-component system nitrogen regulation sensor histidine kinase NtrY